MSRRKDEPRVVVRKGADIDRLPEDADIEVGASVRADRLRFEERPEVEVEVTGDEDSGSGSERENLPHEVEPGVEYRDVRIRWRAAARAREEPQRRET